MIVNLSVKFIQQKYANYYCDKRITMPTVPKVSNDPTRTMSMYFII